MKKIIPDMAFVTETGVSNNPAMNIVVKRRDFPGQSLDHRFNHEGHAYQHVYKLANKGATGGFSV
jgi:hypothetical protein